MEGRKRNAHTRTHIVTDHFVFTAVVVVGVVRTRNPPVSDWQSSILWELQLDHARFIRSRIAVAVVARPSTLF